MSPISDQLEKSLADTASRETPADLSILAEKVSVETVCTCVFGVRAGSFDTKGQTELCQMVYSAFMYNWVDFLYMMATEVPWIKSIMYWFRVPINKHKQFQLVSDTLLSLIQRKKQEGTNDRCITSAFHF